MKDGNHRFISAQQPDIQLAGAVVGMVKAVLSPLNTLILLKSQAQRISDAKYLMLKRQLEDLLKQS